MEVRSIPLSWRVFLTTTLVFVGSGIFHVGASQYWLVLHMLNDYSPVTPPNAPVLLSKRCELAEFCDYFRRLLVMKVTHHNNPKILAEVSFPRFISDSSSFGC